MYKPLYDWLDEQEGRKTSSYDTIKKLQFECKGEHKTIDELADCKECSTLFKPCPMCNKPMGEYPALSRKDNKTDICSNCGTREALENFIARN